MLETYPAGGAKNLIHGFICQLKWLMLFLKRAMDKEYSFRLATELRLAASFDDLVFQYEQNGKIIHRFMQIKHARKRYKKIIIDDLLTHKKNDDFGLVKYLIAYFIIKGSGKFDNGILEDFIIATNADFDLKSLVDKKISVTKIKTKDDFLSIGNSARYKLKDLKGNIAQYLKQSMASMKDKLSKKISNGKKISDEEIDKGIKDFLNKLVFAVNLPNEVELGEIIKNELGKEFNNIDKKNVYGRFLVEVLDWMKAREGKFLSHEEINEFFEKIREEILGAIWFGIIEPVASFTGRSSELKASHDALQRSTIKQAVISQVATISGLGGVGKSELARKYAYKYGKDYYGNVIWISAENSKTMESSFLDLAKDDKLGISPQDKYGNDKMIETIVKETYAFFARRGRKSLFIFDNAEGYKDISKFLPLSLDNKPYILITSRNKDWGISEDEGEIKTIQLGVFKETEALKFVKRALNIRNNLQDEEIKNLTEELQYFPLALKQAVAYINEKNVVLSYRGKEKIGVSDYLKKYEEEAEKLLDFESKYGGDRYTKTTFITWKITIDAIAQKECGFEALSILEIMAYLAPDKIHIEEIFSKLIADDEEKLWNAVKLLDRYSMIDLKEGVANIHRLVQKVTELNLQKEGREEEVLRKALELINSGNIVKDSTIHVASIWGYASKYGKLIDDFYFSSSYVHGEPLFIKKSAPLHFLAVSGDYEAISAIITHIERHYPGELVKTVNVKDNLGQTPLHHASYNGNLRVVEYLISKGADINVRSENDWVPLHYAPRSGVLAVVKHLISKGADVNARSKDDWVPLHLAACIGELDVVKCLINKGADVNANATKPLYYGTPLHLAAYHGKLNITKCLISEGADVNARDGNNCTSVHRAAYSGKLGVVEYLISKGADVNAEDKDGNIPLHKAVQNGKLNVIKYFVGKGADVNAKNRYDWTLLHWAAYNGQLDMVRYLINKGAEINAKSWSNDTPLHLAVCSGVLDAVKCLVGKGAEVNAKSRYGGTTLCLAAMTGNVDIAKVLLKHNADVNARNNLGNTVLDCAVDNCQELVELLLAHGASHDY